MRGKRRVAFLMCDMKHGEATFRLQREEFAKHGDPPDIIERGKGLVEKQHRQARCE